MQYALIIGNNIIIKNFYKYYFIVKKLYYICIVIINNKTMAKYKITTIEEKEIDLPEYPFYVCNNSYWVKHISDNECILVAYLANLNDYEIRRSEPYNHDYLELNYCTESEFNEKFNEALKIITK